MQRGNSTGTLRVPAALLLPAVLTVVAVILLPAPWNIAAPLALLLLQFAGSPPFREYFRQLFLTWRFFQLLWSLTAAFVLGFFYAPLFIIAKLLFTALLFAMLFDMLALYSSLVQLSAGRVLPRRLSNGDANLVQLTIKNSGALQLYLRIIDEIPHQFQKRDFTIATGLAPGEVKTIQYQLRPVIRGEYQFGSVNLFAATVLGLVERRIICPADAAVPVYPSFMQMRKYELLAFSSKLEQGGIKKVRRIGHSYEFDHIKEYTRGDDYRSINWKASARRSKLMINHYEDERAQPVYAVVDMGRNMKSPFAGMTLLEYAINTSLVLLNNAMHRGDRAGLISFSEEIRSFIPADRGKGHMARVLDALYSQETGFRESNFERLAGLVFNKIRQRSLLLIFTNFESSVSLARQMVHLTSLAVNHIPLVIFFRNAEVEAMAKAPAAKLRDIYDVVLAEDFVREKLVIAAQLRKHGILSLLTTPESLTIDTLNKYLELKAMGVI